MHLKKTASLSKVIIRTSNCFTPRNLAINTDGRILGVRVQEFEIIKARQD